MRTAVTEITRQASCASDADKRKTAPNQLLDPVPFLGSYFSGSAGTRTQDLAVKSRMLYQLSYRPETPILLTTNAR